MEQSVSCSSLSLWLERAHCSRSALVSYMQALSCSTLEARQEFSDHIPGQVI